MYIILYRSILLHCVHLWYIHLLPPCSRATIYRRYLKFNSKYNMNFKTFKLYYKLCRTHYMFRSIWQSSGVKSYIKIALKLLHFFVCFPASRFRSIVHWYVRYFLLLFLSCLCRVPLLWVCVHVCSRSQRTWTLGKSLNNTILCKDDVFHPCSPVTEWFERYLPKLL
jgi:hypothetical protein